MADGEMTVAQLATALRSQRGEISAHKKECLDVRRETNAALKALNDRFADLNKTAWRAVGAIALVILSAVAIATGTVVAQSWSAQRSAAAEARQAATTVANQATQGQREILGKLNSLTPSQ